MTQTEFAVLIHITKSSPQDPINYCCDFKNCSKMSFISGIIKKFSFVQAFSCVSILRTLKSNSDVVILNHTKMST